MAADAVFWCVCLMHLLSTCARLVANRAESGVRQKNSLNGLAEIEKVITKAIFTLMTVGVIRSCFRSAVVID
ncbi:MAG: hypothetical protein ACLRXQ_02180 [Phascolarctobacterium faecium]